MTTKDKIEYLQFAQEIADLNNRLLAGIKEDVSEDEGESLMQASKQLVLAQTNIIKSVNK